MKIPKIPFINKNGATPKPKKINPTVATADEERIKRGRNYAHRLDKSITKIPERRSLSGHY